MQLSHSGAPSPKQSNSPVWNCAGSADMLIEFLSEDDTDSDTQHNPDNFR